MNIVILAAALGLIAAATLTLPVGASAQGYGVPAGPKIGEMEVKAYQTIPKAKIAVQRADLAHHAHALRDGRRQGAVGSERIVSHPGRQGTECWRCDHQSHLRQ